MLRLTQYMEELKSPTPLGPKRRPPGPVVIWNLIRRCNLACIHCYTNSMDADFLGELSTAEVFNVMDDLKAYRVPVLILSGGEPLLRADIYDIAARAKQMGFYTGLSTNGTYIDESNIARIRQIGFDYVGISLDGIGDVHDHFRRKKGAYDLALRGIRLCRQHDIKVGIRCTLTRENYQSLDELLELMEREDINKFYLSHLNYSGRGNRNRGKDAHYQMTRAAMDKVFAAAWDSVQNRRHREFVTGNNDADAVYLLQWARHRFSVEAVAHLQAKLSQWGGNSTGVNIANIDNLGNVHPDSFWWDYTLGNVHERKFSDIWSDKSEPLMGGLKSEHRPLKGRCAECNYLKICNGNTRVRAWQVAGDFWAEDPGCYLEDREIHGQAVPTPSSGTAVHV